MQSVQAREKERVWERERRDSTGKNPAEWKKWCRFYPLPSLLHPIIPNRGLKSGEAVKLLKRMKCTVTNAPSSLNASGKRSRVTEAFLFLLRLFKSVYPIALWAEVRTIVLMLSDFPPPRNSPVHKSRVVETSTLRRRLLWKLNDGLERYGDTNGTELTLKSNRTGVSMIDFI